MELRTPRPISSLNHSQSSTSTTATKQVISPAQPHCILCNLPLSLRLTSVSLSHQGLQSYKYSSLKSTTSDEASSGSNQFIKDEPVVNGQQSEEKEHGKSTPNGPAITFGQLYEEKDRSTSDVKAYDENLQGEGIEEYFPSEVQKKISEFFDKLNLEFVDDSYSILAVGGSAAAALYFAIAVVGAIDSIPVFPKLMEVVGLGYTVWFTSRYLLFKKNRDDLSAKIEGLKHEVLGSKDE